MECPARKRVVGCQGVGHSHLNFVASSMDKWCYIEIGQGGWTEPEYLYKAEPLGQVVDKPGTGKKLRVWHFL